MHFWRAGFKMIAAQPSIRGEAWQYIPQLLTGLFLLGGLSRTPRGGGGTHSSTVPHRLMPQPLLILVSHSLLISRKGLESERDEQGKVFNFPLLLGASDPLVESSFTQHSPAQHSSLLFAASRHTGRVQIQGQHPPECVFVQLAH